MVGEVWTVVSACLPSITSEITNALSPASENSCW